MWEHRISGELCEASDSPGPGWIPAIDSDVILSFSEQESSATRRIVTMLEEMRAEVRASYETAAAPSSLEVLALKACADRAKLLLLGQILSRLGKV